MSTPRLFALLAVAAVAAVALVGCGAAPQPLFGSVDTSLTSADVRVASCVAVGVCAETDGSETAEVRCRAAGGEPRRGLCARQGILASCAAEHTTLFTYADGDLQAAQRACSAHAGAFATY